MRLDLDPGFVDRILELALEYETSECMYIAGVIHENDIDAPYSVEIH